jgi:hypothetical protein
MDRRRRFPGGAPAPGSAGSGAGLQLAFGILRVLPGEEDTTWPLSLRLFALRQVPVSDGEEPTLAITTTAHPSFRDHGRAALGCYRSVFGGTRRRGIRRPSADERAAT